MALFAKRRMVADLSPVRIIARFCAASAAATVITLQPAFAQDCDRQICAPPPPKLNSVEVGPKKQFKSINAALKRLEPGGTVTVYAGDGNPGLHSDQPIRIDVNATIVGAPVLSEDQSVVNPNSKRVRLTANGQCFLVNPGVSLTLRNLNVAAQGTGASACIFAGKSARVEIDNVRIEVRGDQTGHVIKLDQKATLVAPENSKATSELYGSVRTQREFTNDGQAAIFAASEASLNLDQTLMVEDVFRGIDAEHSVIGVIRDAEIIADKYDLNMKGNGEACDIVPGKDCGLIFLGGTLGDRTKGYSTSVNVESAAALIFQGTDLMSNGIAVAPGSSVNIVLEPDSRNPENTNNVFGAITLGDDVRGRLSITSAAISTQRLLSQSPNPKDKGNPIHKDAINVGAGFTGALALNDVTVKNHDVGVLVADAGAKDSIDINDLHLTGVGETGVVIKAAAPVSAIKRIDIDDLRPDNEFEAPLMIDRENGLCDRTRNKRDRLGDIEKKISIRSFSGKGAGGVERRICER